MAAMFEVGLRLAKWQPPIDEGQLTLVVDKSIFFSMEDRKFFV